MALDPKWQNRLNDKYNKYLDSNREYDDKYERDDTMKDESVVSKLIIASAIAAGSVALFKTGALRPMISKSLEVAGSIKGYIPEGLEAFRFWTKEAKENVPNSLFNLFRKQLSSVEQVKNILSNQNLKRETITDVKNLKDMFKERMQIVKDRQLSLMKYSGEETDLMYDIKNLHEMMNNVKNDLVDYQQPILNKSIEELLRSRKESPTGDIAKLRLKRTGYRKLTIGDVFKIDPQSGKLVNSVSSFEFGDESLKNIRKLFSGYENTKLGKGLDSNKWKFIKDITIDKNLMINNKNKILDTRVASNSFKKFVETATYDFQIPLIRIRPIEMLGLHNKFLNKELKFGYISKDTFQPLLTKQTGRVKLGDYTQGKSLVFINGNVFKPNKLGGLDLLEKGKIIPVRTEMSGYGISKEADMIRKIGDLNIKKYNKFDREDGFLKYWYSKTMDTLGLGTQDASSHGFNIFDPYSYGEILNTFKPLSPFKSVEGIRIQNAFGAPKDTPTYLFMQKGKTISDVYQGHVGITDYFKQFVAGRNDLNNVTPKTFPIYHMFDRLSNSLGTVGVLGVNFGLPTKDLGSAFSIFKNLMLKRVLPVYLGIQGYQYLNTESENLTGTQIEDKAANIFANTDLAWHGIKDSLGITNFAKKLSELMPGTDQITEIPGLGFLDMTKTKEEKEQYYKTGEDPVRKGRYWLLGNTPFTGQKINYYQPNLYRRIISDYKYTDSMYGSRDEYFENSATPTLSHPLSPIKHFITDPYHYENKHYEDRPYMQTAPMFANLPVFGPILSATIGKILKPQKKMHLEYWGSQQQEGAITDPGKPGVEPLSDNTAVLIPNEEIFSTKFNEGGTIIPKYSEGTVPLETPIQYKQKEEQKQVDNDMVYVTPSGSSKVVSIPQGISIKDLNEQIKKESLRRVRGVEETRGNKYVQNKQSVEKILNDLTAKTSEQYTTLTDVAGIYGFGVESLLGEGISGTELETPDYAYSTNRAFWENELGGIGSEISEIGRRFMRKRKRQIEYYNPIRNTQSTWMPGNDYFKDFQSGDPYTKVPKGEMRLPGEGYEKISQIDPLALNITTSYIGQSKEKLVSHFLHEDDSINEEMKDFIGKGPKVEIGVKSALNKMGILIDKDVAINDRKNKITGLYDARIYDQTSSSGKSIIDIKTLSEKSFNQLNNPLEAHVEQLNYMLNVTKNNKGYLYYANKEDPKNIKIFDINYNQGMYEQTINNVNEARKIINTKLQNKEIQRGDLYSYFERFKILADVAPYSKEYREYKSLMQSVYLTDEQEKEIKKTREQVIEAKKPLRLYPYKFKNLDLKKRTVTVKRKIENNMFLTEEFPDNPIELAGISITNSLKTEEGKYATKVMDQYLKPGTKLTIGIDSDPLSVVKNNTYKTIKSVVYNGSHNLNKSLLSQGIAKEDVNDESTAAMNVRYNKPQRLFGSMWESISHMNTILHCISPTTQIITSKGVKVAKNLCIGDLVLTNKGNFKPITNICDQPKGKKILDIKLKSSNILLTTTYDHPILACKKERKYRHISQSTGEFLEPYGKNPNIEFIHAENLEEYDYIVYKPRKMIDNINTVIDIKKLNENRFIEENNILYSRSINKTADKNKKSINRFLPVTDKLMRLLGYYAAEGCIAKARGRVCYTIFVFNKNEKEYIDDVCNIVYEIFGVESRVVYIKNTCQIRVGSIFLSEIVNYYVGNKWDKKAPEELLQSKITRSEFIRGLMRGDGTKAGHSRYDVIGMNAINILTWLRDAIFDLWKMSSCITLGIKRKNNLYKLTIGTYDDFALFIDSNDKYEDKIFYQRQKYRNNCVVNDYILYRIEYIKYSKYQDYTIDVEVKDDDSFSTINASVHNTKFLQVRSPIESYERRNLYGKDFQSWAHPIRDILKPVIDQHINGKFGMLSGAFIGSLFGRSFYGKIIGATAGLLTVGIGKSKAKIHELNTGEKWIPERRKKEWQINEYIDVLKFIKYKKLYTEYAHKSKLKENFDVQKFLDDNKKKGEETKLRNKDLQEAKRIVKLKGDIEIKSIIDKYKPKYVKENMGSKEAISNINKELLEQQQKREVYKIPKIAQKALAYYNLSKETMYGYESGDPLTNILSAIPKVDRQYLSEFMKAKGEDRIRILKESPRYIRRILEQSWGMPVENKPDLIKYFRKHQLPDPKWRGWQEDVNMDALKVKLVKHEALDVGDFNIWEDQQKIARETGEIPIPKLNTNIEDHAEKIKSKLEDLLHGIGMKDIKINYEMSSSDVNVNINLNKDKRKEIEVYIQQRGKELFK